MPNEIKIITTALMSHPDILAVKWDDREDDIQIQYVDNSIMKLSIKMFFPGD